MPHDTAAMLDAIANETSSFGSKDHQEDSIVFRSHYAQLRAELSERHLVQQQCDSYLSRAKQCLSIFCYNQLLLYAEKNLKGTEIKGSSCENIVFAQLEEEPWIIFKSTLFYERITQKYKALLK